MNPASRESFWSAAGRMFAVLATRVRQSLDRRHSVHRLRLSETLSLGEKRFLAVVQFQRQEFLVGGTGSSIALLAKLNGTGVPDKHDDALQVGV